MTTTTMTANPREAGSALWARYAVAPDASLRDALIQQYAPLVKYVVDRLRLALSGALDRDDLLGYGTIGLIEAVDRFDPARGVKFESYAIPRVRGAIIDATRALDLVPRSARQRARAIEGAYRELFVRDGRMPDEATVATHLGLTSAQFRQALQDAACAVLPLDHPDRDGDATIEEMLADPQAASPPEAAARAEMLAGLTEALGTLSERDRLVVALYYYEELTLKEIGAVLDITESRVSQLLTRARLQLRARLHERGMVALDLSS